MGSIIERDSLVIAITSGGKAPVLARMLREKIETIIPASYSSLVNYVGKLRGFIKKNIKSGNKRRIFWENFFESNFVDKFNSKRNILLKKLLLIFLKRKYQRIVARYFLLEQGLVKEIF